MTGLNPALVLLAPVAVGLLLTATPATASCVEPQEAVAADEGWACRIAYNRTRGAVSRMAYCPTRRDGMRWLGEESSGAAGVIFVSTCERSGEMMKMGDAGAMAEAR